MAEIATRFDNAFRDYETDRVPSSGVHEPVKSEIRMIGKYLETAISSTGAGIARFATKAAMDAAPLTNTDADKGKLAYVWNDSTPANRTVYQWSGTAWVVASWYFDAVAGVVYAQIATKLTELGTLFEEGATDAYAKLLFRDIVIGGGDPDDTYFLNYQTNSNGGSLYRVHVNLHSVAAGGAKVAKWEFEQVSNPTSTLPATIHLTLVGDGSPLPGDIGITALVTPDWTKLDWTKALTAYTGPAATGIKRGKVVTPEAVEANFLGARTTYRKRITVGATTGQFATVVAAIASIERAEFAVPITRSTYPATHDCTAEAPLLIEIVDAGHDELVTPFTNASIDQSPIRLPHGCILRMRHDSRLYMTHATNTAPVVEMNFTSRIEGGGLVERQGASGYCIHIDIFNKISLRAASGQRVLRRWMVTHIDGIRFKVASGHAATMIGIGLSNRHYVRIARCDFQRAGTPTTNAFVLAHTNPTPTDPGTIELVDCTSNQIGISGTDGILIVQKLHVTDIRHRVIVRTSDADKVSWSNTASPAGTSGFVRGGTLPGITYPTALNP